ncbi:MAG: hypothetical protein FJ301_09945, partial [Planctomycetes bacterium]|nr:hypothetical protein [Planctomycetota bacterium]
MPNRLMSHAVRSPSSVLAAFVVLAAAATAQGDAKLTFADTKKPLQWQGAAPPAQLVDGGRKVELRVDGKAVWFDPATGALAEKPADQASPPPSAARKVVVVRDGDLWLDEVAPGGNGGRRRGGAR